MHTNTYIFFLQLANTKQQLTLSNLSYIGLGTSLRPSIDFAGVQCLNESRPNSGRDILKLYEDRMNRTPNLTSQVSSTRR